MLYDAYAGCTKISLACIFPPQMLEIYGLVIFLGAMGYTMHSLNKEKQQLATDRRAVWKRAEDLLKLREEEGTKRQELQQGFDRKSNLPMILGFLGGDNKNNIKDIAENLDIEEVQNLLNGGGKK